MSDKPALILPDEPQTYGQQRIARLPAQHPAVPVAQSETASLLDVISRAARDPAVDLDKLERLMQMHDRVLDRSAKEAFAAAFAEMVPNLPPIDRNGGITVYSKSDRDYAAKNNGEYPPNAKPIQSTPYATIDDILSGINPVLSEYGFAVRFEHETVPTGDSYRIRTRCILMHKDGHSENAETPPLMQDSSGSKNNVQSVGSSMKYGKRYALMAVLPIISHAPQDRDDDGKRAGAATINEEQLAEIEDIIRTRGVDRQKLLEYLKIDALEAFPATKFENLKSIVLRARGNRDQTNG